MMRKWLILLISANILSSPDAKTNEFEDFLVRSDIIIVVSKASVDIDERTVDVSKTVEVVTGNGQLTFQLKNPKMVIGDAKMDRPLRASAVEQLFVQSENKSHIPMNKSICALDFHDDAEMLWLLVPSNGNTKYEVASRFGIVNINVLPALLDYRQWVKTKKWQHGIDIHKDKLLSVLRASTDNNSIAVTIAMLRGLGVDAEMYAEIITVLFSSKSLETRRLCRDFLLDHLDLLSKDKLIEIANKLVLEPTSDEAFSFASGSLCADNLNKSNVLDDAGKLGHYILENKGTLTRTGKCFVVK